LNFIPQASANDKVALSLILELSSSPLITPTVLKPNSNPAAATAAI